MAIKPLKLSREDLSKDIPAWMDQVFEQVNTWAASVTNEINAPPKIATKVVTIKTGTSIYDAFPIDIPNPLSVRPTFVICGQVQYEDGTAVYDQAETANWQMEGNIVRLTHLYGISSNTIYKATLVIGGF
jgi:hypothetical protein